MTGPRRRTGGWTSWLTCTGRAARRLATPGPWWTGPVRVSFIHGAGVRDFAESLENVRAGIQAGAQQAGLPLAVEELELSQVEYGSVLAALPDPKARERPKATGETHNTSAQYMTCACCPPGVGYRLYSALLLSVGTPLSAARYIVDFRFPDVAKYSLLEKARSDVISKVAVQLREQKPDALIAHSLGTVVAVDALRVLEPEERPRLLITAGSPLARHGLFDVSPDWVASSDMLWINLVDVTDEVTGGADLDSYLWSGSVNMRVNNDRYSKWLGADGGWSATHHIRHYLTHPITAKLLRYLQARPGASKQELQQQLFSPGEGTET